MKEKTYDFFERGGNKLHVEAKIIASRYSNTTLGDGNISVVTSTLHRAKVRSSYLVNSQIVDSEVAMSSVIGGEAMDKSDLYESTSVESTLSRTRLLGSKVFRLWAEGSSLINSTVSWSKIFDTEVRNSVLHGAYALNSKLQSCIVEAGVRIEDVIAGDTYFRDGVWKRSPFSYHPDELLYAVTEDVDDRVLIGCQSRTGDFWMNLNMDQAARLGREFVENFDLYRACVGMVMRHKRNNPSPASIQTVEPSIDPFWSAEEGEQNAKS